VERGESLRIRNRKILAGVERGEGEDKTRNREPEGSRHSNEGPGVR
jgi:hypothetical protein